MKGREVMKIDDIWFTLKDGRKALLTGPGEEYIQGTLDYLLKSAGETEFIIRYPEECAEKYSLEKETECFKRFASDPNMAFFICVVDGKVAGNCQISFGSSIKTKHRSDIGIAILKDYWGLGIGTKMFEEMILVAEKRKETRQIELDFIEGNSRARALYEKMGFRITGVRNDAIRLKDGRILNEYHMIKMLRNEANEKMSLYPCIEFDEGEEAKVDPVKFLAGESLGSDKMVITFFPDVVKKLKEENKIELVDTLNGESPLEIYKFVGSDVLLVKENVGCPACSGDLECFYGMGVRKVMFCGGGGVLDKDIAVGTLLVVEGAIRDESFSFHYIAPGRIIYTDPVVVRKVDDFLEKKDIPYINALAWTTDAMFRETPSRIERRKAEGAKVVEMEQSGNLAIAQYRKFDYGAIIYGGDDVSGEKWDNRGWMSREGVRYDLVMLCKEIVKTL